MKKTHILTQPTRIQDLNFDDMYDDFNDKGSQRSERLRIRSYRKLRQQES